MNTRRKQHRFWNAAGWFGFGILLIGFGFNCNQNTAAKVETEEALPNVNPTLKEIIRCGALAPSSHNAQMWRIRIDSDSRITLLLDQRHCLPEVDPTNREALISLGAMIENMDQVAFVLGYRTELHVLTDTPGKGEIAQLTFCKMDSIEKRSDIIATVENRHTLRTPFRRAPLEAAIVKQLNSVNAALHFFSVESSGGKYIQAATLQAMQQQTANDRKQKELSRWMRFSNQEIAAHQDGVTPAMMGLKGVAKWFVSRFYSSKTVTSPSFRKQTLTTARKQVQNCAGFFIVTSVDNSVPSLIEAGRTLERFWLEATRLKVAVHPMTQALEEAPWRNEISARLGITQPIQLVLRVGYVTDYGKPTSQRRDLKHIIL